VNRVSRWALVLSLLAALVGACVGPGQADVTHATYGFWCCPKADTSQVWHPGEAVAVQWGVRRSNETLDNTPHRIDLTAVITGPFDQATLKNGGVSGALTVRAAVVTTDDRTPTPPVSMFAIPANLPLGLYNLRIKVDSGGDNWMASDSVIRVG
jgi:hypothetical protein